MLSLPGGGIAPFGDKFGNRFHAGGFSPLFTYPILNLVMMTPSDTRGCRLARVWRLTPELNRTKFFDAVRDRVLGSHGTSPRKQNRLLRPVRDWGTGRSPEPMAMGAGKYSVKHRIGSRGGGERTFVSAFFGDF